MLLNDVRSLHSTVLDCIGLYCIDGFKTIQDKIRWIRKRTTKQKKLKSRRTWHGFSFNTR